MNLLIDAWIPVRPKAGGEFRNISLQELLCGSGEWFLSLPRDDFELAAFQLLICIVQVLWTPEDRKDLERRIQSPMDEKSFKDGIEPVMAWFQLDHPDHPFMQTRGVNASFPTPMDKLMAGLDTSTNSRFVNEQGLSDRICAGCAAIALYNQANNAPSFGGGFKFGLRGSCPVSTLLWNCLPGIDDLRSSIWFNILTRESLQRLFQTEKNSDDLPTWLIPIKKGVTIHAESIGLFRGLFWQPVHVELIRTSHDQGSCRLCGRKDGLQFEGFYKEKFTFSVKGFWPHPHSPYVIKVAKGVASSQFLSFKAQAPSWTHLGRFVVRKEFNDESREGQRPAAVFEQAKSYWENRTGYLVFIVGGYRNNSAAILERLHDVFRINAGWEGHLDVIDSIVDLGVGYRKALGSGLTIFNNGIMSKDRKTKGIGLNLPVLGRMHFYRRSEETIHRCLYRIDFSNPTPALKDLEATLVGTVRGLFEELIDQYVHDPELLRTRAIARRTMEKKLKDLAI